MKKINNWAVKEYTDKDMKTPVNTFERTSLTKVLMSFIKLLSGVKVFILDIPDVKTYVVYRKNKQEDK